MLTRCSNAISMHENTGVHMQRSSPALYHMSHVFSKRGTIGPFPAGYHFTFTTHWLFFLLLFFFTIFSLRYLFLHKHMCTHLYGKYINTHNHSLQARSSAVISLRKLKVTRTKRRRGCCQTEHMKEGKEKR